MIIPAPSLSPSGWVTEIRKKADLLMAYFFYSDASQSNFYLKNITALPDIIQMYGNSQLDLQTEITARLTKYLERYFELVSIDTKVTIPENIDDNRMDVAMAITITQENIKYDMSKLLRIANSKVVEIIERNNTGE